MFKYEKQVEAWIKEWSEILYISHWAFIVILEDKSKPNEDFTNDCAAWVERDSKYLRAYLHINTKGFEEEWKENGEKVCKSHIIHELVHVFLNDYDDLIELKWQTEENYTSTRERIAEILTRILINNMPTKKKTKKPAKGKKHEKMEKKGKKYC